MKVYKFGGTSVGTVERMKHVAELISESTPKIVVLSATQAQPIIWKKLQPTCSTAI